MPELTLSALFAAFLSLVTGVFNTVVGVLRASYEASHKWFAVGCGIFALLVWFGYAHLPTFSSKDATLEKQVAELSAKIDKLSSSIDELKAPAPVVTGSIKKKLK